MWPVIISLRKAYLLYKYHSTKGHKQLKLKVYSNVMGQKAGMVHLSEVCIESTFLSIINWYILLPHFLILVHLDSPDEILIHLDRHDNSTDNSLILSEVSFFISLLSRMVLHLVYSRSERRCTLSYLGS